MEIVKQSQKHPKRPQWFEDFYNKDYRPFQEAVMKKFNDMDKKMPAWFAYFVEHEFKPLKQTVIEDHARLLKVDKLLHDVIRLNNLKTHE